MSAAAQDYNVEALTMLAAPNLQLNAGLQQVRCAQALPCPIVCSEDPDKLRSIPAELSHPRTVN